MVRVKQVKKLPANPRSINNKALMIITISIFLNNMTLCCTKSYNPYDATSIYLIGAYFEKLKDFEKADEYIGKTLKLQDIPFKNE